MNAERAGYELVIVYNDQDDRLIPMNGTFSTAFVVITLINYLN